MINVNSIQVGQQYRVICPDGHLLVGFVDWVIDNKICIENSVVDYRDIQDIAKDKNCVQFRHLQVGKTYNVSDRRGNKFTAPLSKKLFTNLHFSNGNRINYNSLKRITLKRVK